MQTSLPVSDRHLPEVVDERHRESTDTINAVDISLFTERVHPLQDLHRVVELVALGVELFGAHVTD